MASLTRNSILGFIFIILNLFYLIAAVEAHKDPRILLDQEYQTSLHDTFLILIASFYMAFLLVFFLPLIKRLYIQAGYVDKVKELDQIEITGKK